MVASLLPRLAVVLAAVQGVRALPQPPNNGTLPRPSSTEALPRASSSAASSDGESMRLMDASPNYPFDPNTPTPCTWWWDNDGQIPCADMPFEWGISMADFLRWNPSITSTCGNFLNGRSYCVEGPAAPAVTTTTTTPPATTTAPGNGIETPSPVRPGMATDCDKFYFVKSGDTCAVIASQFGISEQQFLTWNPTVGSTCSGLWAETYYCVKIISFTPPATTTAPSNGVETPVPTRPGMATNCNLFYFVKSGDTCAVIATQYGITEAQFLAWNPTVGSTCTGLWAETYYCVRTIGTTPVTTQPPTTTSTGNGITTPQPIQPGMVSNCNKFYFVKSGDTCQPIATANGITLTQFITWNPQIGGTACTGLWASVYVCIGVIGSTPVTTTTQAPTTTTPNNGITTPQPTQGGMVSNCDRFHFVTSGQTCASIGATYGITAKRISDWNTSVGSTCTGLWANVNVCVRTIGFVPTTSVTCHTASDHLTWGTNLAAAQQAVVSWCDGNASTDGSGTYATAELKRGCYNTPNGSNRIEFVGRNDYGASAVLTVAKCNELMRASIDRCDRGGNGSQEGWWFTSRVVAGRC